MKLTVGIIGRASGIRGEVRVSLRTDDPAARFEPGVTLLTDRRNPAQLTVKRARMSGKHFVVSFEEIPDRNMAETLAGLKLQIDTDSIAPGTVSGDEEFEDGFEADEEYGEEGFYRHEVVGLDAQTPDGTRLGTVSDLILGAAQDLLEVTTPTQEKILVPFVYEIVPEVDLEGKRVIMDPPGGLFPEA